MKQLAAFLILALTIFTTSAHASVRVYNSGGSQIGIFTDIQAGNGLQVNQVSGKAKLAFTPGDGTQAMSGFLKTQTSVSGSLTAAQCGSTITSDSTGGITDTFTLPQIASSIYGCRYTFIVGTNSPGLKRLFIAPNAADPILVISGTAGHTISDDVIGNSIVIEAIAPGWAPVGKEQGTWHGN